MMHPGLLRKTNICLGIVLFFCLIISVIFILSDTPTPPAVLQAEKKEGEGVGVEVSAKEKQKMPPDNSFQAKDADYVAIGEPFLHLSESLPKGRLPDLRAVLVGYGVTARPDAPKEKTPILIGIRGQPNPVTTYRGKTLYLKYDPKSHFRWSFSENNAPTASWVVADVQGGQTVIGFHMKDGQGNLIQDPYEFSFFVLPEIPLPQTNETMADWKIAQEKVDNTLLTRQKAKWYGQDLFLQTYGGPDYEYAQGRERVDFEGTGFNYACYIKEGDLLADNDGEWRVAEAGPDTLDKSLLLVKKVNEQSIAFDLWDQEGKRKISLELHRTPEPQAPAATNPVDIKLVGARSRKDWIAEVGGKRMLLRTDDWLICQGGEWQRLTDTMQIDAYLSGDIKGELIILEGTERVDTEICLVGGKVNETRTTITPISVPLYRSPAVEKQVAEEQDEDEEGNNLPNQKGMKQNGGPKEKKSKNQADADDDGQDDDEDDEEYDDEDDDDFI